MRLYTREECDQWLREKERLKPDETPGVKSVRLAYPAEPHQFFYIALAIARSLTYRLPTLLWITEWGIWSSSENWHLYYRLRQPHGDLRLLHEAPGHLFLEHEAEELASFLQTAMLNGWGGYVLTQANYVNAFFSHDEFIDFYAEVEDNLAEVRDALSEDAGLNRIVSNTICLAGIGRENA